jgi:hypothetical protein
MRDAHDGAMCVRKIAEIVAMRGTENNAVAGAPRSNTNFSCSPFDHVASL